MRDIILELLFYLVISLSILMTILIIGYTKDLFNPVSLTCFFWILPVLFSSFKLSGLQQDEWTDLTYVLLIYSMLAFVILPSIFIFASYKKDVLNNSKEKLEKLSMRINKNFVLVLMFIVVGAYFLENKISSGYIFPILLTNSSIDIHTVSVSILSIITRSFVPVVSLLLFIVYLNEKKRLYIFFIILVMLLPVTRLARFDIVMAVIPLMGLLFTIVKNKRKFMFRFGIVFVIMLILGAAIGELRMTHGYKYNISYAEGISFHGYGGPFDVFAILYGYFALSVENLDRFISANYQFEDFQYGKFMLRPVFVGILKFNNIFADYPLYEYVNEMRNPVAGFATVHTALVDFSMDFGYYLAIIPMVLFSMIGVYMYVNSYKSIKSKIMYLVYSQVYIFMAFQNLFIEPRLWYQLLFFFLLFRFIGKEKNG